MRESAVIHNAYTVTDKVSFAPPSAEIKSLMLVFVVIVLSAMGGVAEITA
jgi:hypothetical protein